jgi:hypothetical protein
MTHRGIVGKFLVHNTFEVPDRPLFVTAGSILQGENAADMLVHIPLNSSRGVTAWIQSVEFAFRRDGGEDVCLCIRSRPETIEIVNLLVLEMLTIGPGGGPSVSDKLHRKCEFL